MVLTIILLAVDLLLFFTAVLFTYESLREQEPRAPKVGLIGISVTIIMAGLILFAPSTRWLIAVLFLGMLAVGLALTQRGRSNEKALKGSAGHVVGQVQRVDERDIVFARNRSVPPGSDVYKQYYEMHPEFERRDAERRKMGGPVGRPGAIDGGYRPNVSMMAATFQLAPMLGPYAEPTPDASHPPCKLDPARASEIVKGFALHLGAAQVGICRADPRWAYSRRGEIFYDNWEDWGKELPDPLPYAVVIATEMDHANVGAGPHTPAVVESATNYAKGAFITTVLAGWFAHMGYAASADHHRHYFTMVVPLAVDAGLGEVGRFGYLITDKSGPRARLFAVTTDMPLKPDKPIDIGAEDFCKMCKKCALSCPSNSIPEAGKTVHNGIEKWKMDEMSCFDYWGRIGTDCSVCMGVCPFSRPNTSIHSVVRWMIKRSPRARRVLPHIDNLIYGPKWKPRPPAEWVDFRREREIQGDPESQAV